MLAIEARSDFALATQEGVTRARERGGVICVGVKCRRELATLISR